MSELASEQTAVEPAAESAPAPEPVAADQLAEGAAAGEATDAGLEAAPEPQAPAAPELDPLEVQARLDYVQSQYDELLGALGTLTGDPAAAGQQQGQPQLQELAANLVDEFGAVNPQALLQVLGMSQQGLLQAIDQRFQQFSAPLEAQREAEQTARGEERLKDVLADDIARNGEFASSPEADAAARERVRQRASDIFEELAPVYGETSRVAEMAMLRAAQQERDYLRAVRGEAASEAVNRLSTLAGAPGEPGGAANGAIGGRPDFGTNTGSIVDHYAREARRLSQAAGS